MTGLSSRSNQLKKYTTSSSVIDELDRYTKNKFTNSSLSCTKKLLSVTADESIHVWEDYLKQSNEIGIFETLKRNLVQLQFPIRKNSSQSTEYRAATLKGEATDTMVSSIGLNLKAVSSLRCFIYESFAGKIPVILTSSHEDFYSLIRALTYRNEPVHIPESMGAALINGLNNWDRIRRLKKEWLENNPLGNWSKEFQKNVLPCKNLYQDKLIVLSKKPYSGVAAKHFGISDEEWLKKSLKIRLEHECAHLYTLKVFGSIANNMHDELIADYMGITNVLGKFKSDWFLRFIGLENYPQYREGARLQNYVNEPKLSTEATRTLRTIIRNAAINLEAFDECLGLPSNQTDRIYRLRSICLLDLLALSLEQGKEKLLDRYHELYKETEEV